MRLGGGAHFAWRDCAVRARGRTVAVSEAVPVGEGVGAFVAPELEGVPDVVTVPLGVKVGVTEGVAFTVSEGELLSVMVLVVVAVFEPLSEPVAELLGVTEAVPDWHTLFEKEAVAVGFAKRRPCCSAGSPAAARLPSVHSQPTVRFIQLPLLYTSPPGMPQEVHVDML